MSYLAIVIPAYKGMFFNKTLLSIANQTCKEFTLYIGNDSSPNDLRSIVESYKDRIDIVYKEFNENLGGKDLVAQWERCIDMVGPEDWIWLFSDDDMMDPTCVENFYQNLKKYPQSDLFHFNVTHIDENKNIVCKSTNFPEVLTSEEFLIHNLNGIYSFVVEYIFRKSHFYEIGRFQNFDLAWCSDNATWIKLGRRMGIRNIPNSNVYFRTSLFNITPNYKDKTITRRKFYSQIEYICWINELVDQKGIHLEELLLKDHIDEWFFGAVKSKIEFISFVLLKDIICQFESRVNNRSCSNWIIVFFFMIKILSFIKSILKKVLFWKHFKLLRFKIPFALSSILI